MSKSKKKLPNTNRPARRSVTAGSTLQVEYHVEAFDSFGCWRDWYVTEVTGKRLNPTTSLKCALGLYRELCEDIRQGCGWKKARIVRYAVTRQVLSLSNVEPSEVADGRRSD